MKAAVYRQFQQPLELISVEDPTPADDGVVLEVKCTGMCLSDWHGWMGHDQEISLPHIPGHEMSGIIVEVGLNVSKWKHGDRVTLPFVCGCGRCDYCIEGNPQVCDHQFQPGFTHWGSFAPFVGIHYAEHNLVSIPESVDFESAAILGCRFATSFRALIDQAAIKPGQIIAVYGCGGVGLSCLLIAKAMKAQVVMIDLDPLKLKFATELGADYTILGSGPSVSMQVVELTKGGVHISIDAVGKAGIVKSSLNSLRKGGKHIQIGLLNPDEQEIAIPFERIVANELQIAGSHGMQASRYIEMMDLITKGRLNPGLLVQHTISLEKSLSLLPNLNSNQLAGVTLINEFT